MARKNYTEYNALFVLAEIMRANGANAVLIPGDMGSRDRIHFTDKNTGRLIELCASGAMSYENKNAMERGDPGIPLFSAFEN